MDFSNIDTSPNHKSNKYCFVPSCRNTTYTTPEKHFISVPKNDEVRKQWCIAANCPDKRLETESYCCEDHFDLKEDLENYFYVTTVPNARKILKEGVVPRFFNTANTATTSKNTNFTEIMINMETLDGSNDLMKEEILNNSIKNVKQEPIYENDQDLYTSMINYEEVMIKSEIFDENVVMEVERIKNETPEEDSNDINSVVSVCENDQQLCTINYENIKPEQELHTELIIKDEILNEKSILESQEIHTPSTNQSFSCDQSSLVQHKRIHSGEKPFSCDICKKTFTEKSSLVKHKQIHSGQKQFLCDICNKTFSQQGNLVAHKRIHSGEKPFSCDICKKTFTEKSNLVKHKKIHSGENSFACDICNKTFTYQHNLVQHKQIDL
ncbi:zinc finger protein 568-like [Chrysoperla carnea]|uniref:zinc finger protein 568-like n=1 Tax=Chrysoperla carnea TaxID=189513 RepID=UPI001D08D920|nr:zinc finger protein 568-like [Chrysoperla carnea]